MILLLIPSFIDCGVQPLRMSKPKQHGQLASMFNGANDFKGYLDAKSAQALIADLLSECRLQIQSGYDLLALERCLKAHDVAPVVVKAVVQFYTDRSEDCDELPLEPIVPANGISEAVYFYNPTL